MDSQLPSIMYPALKQLLLNRLQVALGLYILPNDLVLNKQQDSLIYLYRAKDGYRVIYISSIALQLSQASKIPPLEIATALVKLLVDDNITSLIPQTKDFSVQVVAPGWIHLEITEPKLAAWLQNLSQAPPWFPDKSQMGKEGKISPVTSNLFAVQYAHARCCSIMQLAHREGLVELKELQPDISFAVLRVVNPDPIPWLNSDQRLHLTRPFERALISQLIGLVDDLYFPCPSRKVNHWKKAALNLSQAFQNFYSCCQIWGEVKIDMIHLAQARLGLIIATQVILRLLLQECIGIPAPLEL